MLAAGEHALAQCASEGLSWRSVHAIRRIYAEMEQDRQRAAAPREATLMEALTAAKAELDAIADGQPDLVDDAVFEKIDDAIATAAKP